MYSSMINWFKPVYGVRIGSARYSVLIDGHRVGAYVYLGIMYCLFMLLDAAGLHEFTATVLYIALCTTMIAFRSYFRILVLVPRPETKTD